MKCLEVTLYDVAENGTERGWINIDSIQMIISRSHLKSIPPPTTLVLGGRSVRVTETPEEIFNAVAKLTSKEAQDV